jgi:hypothetical protein
MGFFKKKSELQSPKAEKWKKFRIITKYKKKDLKSTVKLLFSNLFKASEILVRLSAELQQFWESAFWVCLKSENKYEQLRKGLIYGQKLVLEYNGANVHPKRIVKLVQTQGDCFSMENLKDSLKGTGTIVFSNHLYLAYKSSWIEVSFPAIKIEATERLLLFQQAGEARAFVSWITEQQLQFTAKQLILRRAKV